MFDYEFQTEVKRVEALVPKVDGPVAKACRLTFRRGLDEDIARSLAGEFGVAALKHLRDRGITKVDFPIDAISARCWIKSRTGQEFAIPVVTGMKAVAKAKKLQEDEDPEDPTVELKFQFPYTAEAWAILGETVTSTVTIKLSRNQLELPLAAKPATNGNGDRDTKPANKRGRPKKGGVLTTKSSHGDDRAEAAGEIGDPQDAATPEEAEERSQRLREERARDEGAWADGAH